MTRRTTAILLLAVVGLLAAGTLSPAGRTPVVQTAPERTIVRFGVITDLHYADRDSVSGRIYRESTGKLAEFVSVMNREKADFVIELGDYKDQDVQPVPARTLSFLRTIEGVFVGFKGPRYHVLGNHDEDSLTKAEFLGAIENTGISDGRTYYSFDQGGVHFIVLDPNFRSDGRE
ncbi:MAG: metallophosphoesterase, partial [Candidatus Aminicenantes bacterium]|nr:metallophosphoesterase [Candidatus Aminicenantes bacterium]